MPQCESGTRSGERCKNSTPGKFCHHHQNQTEQCAVCWSGMTDTTSRKLDCGHTFHTRCLDRWKRRSATCPMCRTPFDQPRYRVRLTIEPDGQDIEMITSNIANISNLFGIDNTMDEFFTDIRFAVDNFEILNEILREIGFPSSNLTSLNAVSTTEF